MADADRTQPVTSSSSNTAPDQAANALTPSLVRTVTAKVYALLLADLQIERERLRIARGAWQQDRRR